MAVMKPGYAQPAVDHVIPYSKGGTEDLDNLVLCCQSCNSGKGVKSLEEYVQYRLDKGLPVAPWLLGGAE